MRRPLALGAAVFVMALLALASAGCGAGSSRASGAASSAGVTIEALTPTPPATPVRIGGKPAAPPPSPSSVAAPTPAPTEAAASVAPATAEATVDVPAASATPPAADAGASAGGSPAAGALASDGSVAPTEGRWIDVNVTTFTVRLMDGTAVTREIAPVGVGLLIDTGDYASTQTGLFNVYNKAEELVYDAPYNTYISEWVGFDPAKANGFHSLLKDKDGNVVDASTGRISNGCIRTGAADAVFAFAEIGMPVWVHY